MTSWAFTLPNIAKMFGVSQKTVKAWVDSGQLEAIDVSRDSSPQRRRLRVTSDALQEFLDRRTVSSEQPPPPQPRRRRSSTPARQWV